MGEDKPQEREINSGRYAFDGNMDRLCVCGHTLGMHSAVKVRVNGKSIQDCLVSTVAPYTPCDCQCFKPRPTKRAVP